MSAIVVPRDVQRLLNAAMVEAERSVHSVVTPAHVAVAVARMHPELAGVLGEGVEQRALTFLGQMAHGGGTPRLDQAIEMFLAGKAQPTGDAGPLPMTVEGLATFVSLCLRPRGQQAGVQAAVIAQPPADAPASAEAPTPQPAEPAAAAVVPATPDATLPQVPPATPATPQAATPATPTPATPTPATPTPASQRAAFPPPQSYSPPTTGSMAVLAEVPELAPEGPVLDPRLRPGHAAPGAVAAPPVPPTRQRPVSPVASGRPPAPRPPAARDDERGAQRPAGDGAAASRQHPHADPSPTTGAHALHSRELPIVDAPSPSAPAAQPSGSPGSRSFLVTMPTGTVALVGREAVTAQIVAVLSQRQRVTPLVIAPAGAGRSTIAAALADDLRALPPGHPCSGLAVVRVDADRLLAAADGPSLTQVLAAAAGLARESVVVIDDLEAITGLGTAGGVDPVALGAVQTLVRRGDRRVVLLLAQEYLDALAAADSQLLASLAIIPLPQLTPAEILTIARVQARQLAAFHGVQLPEHVVGAACGPAGVHDAIAHPSLAIRRLDRAAAAARLAGGTATVDGLGLGHDLVGGVDHAAASSRLGAAVRGQAEVVARLADRLVVRSAGLDLRPGRPDAVLLFSGPTGVGKTAMAHALAAEVFSDPGALVYLDMSQYADEQAAARLIGHGDGADAVLSDCWLTTRMRERSDVVLFLDDIDRAHPAVWSLVARAIDTGRVIDNHGGSASLDEVVVVMTTTLGSDLGGSHTSGLPDVAGPDGDLSPSEAVARSVKRMMPPELVNRIDDVLVFHQLTQETVREIADVEVARLIDRLRQRGFDLEVDPEVVEFVADLGYSREHGARQLLRVVEHEVLAPLVKLGPGSYRGAVVGAKVLWMRRGH